MGFYGGVYEGEWMAACVVERVIDRSSSLHITHHRHPLATPHSLLPFPPPTSLHTTLTLTKTPLTTPPRPPHQAPRPPRHRTHAQGASATGHRHIGAAAAGSVGRERVGQVAGSEGGAGDGGAAGGGVGERGGGGDGGGANKAQVGGICGDGMGNGISMIACQYWQIACYGTLLMCGIADEQIGRAFCAMRHVPSCTEHPLSTQCN